MEINIKEAKSKLGSLLDRSQKGEEVVIVRRGRRIARLVPVSNSDKRLPDLKDFRDSITVKGGTLGSDPSVSLLFLFHLFNNYSGTALRSMVTFMYPLGRSDENRGIFNHRGQKPF